MAIGNVYIGTAGFSYKDWLGNFYPQFCPPADFLRCYAMQFPSVELDSTFYRIPTREMVEKWAGMTPDGFIFSAKFPRTVTHEGDLDSRLEEAKRFVDTMAHFGKKLGPLLLQFPGSFKPGHRALLEALIGTFGKKAKLSVEFRSKEWLTDETFQWLESNGIGLCLAAYPGMPPTEVRTARHVYIRLVGDRRAITEDFSYVRDDRADELDWWEELAARFAGENADIYAYFNNHYTGHAPSTAMDFKESLERRLNSGH